MDLKTTPFRKVFQVKQKKTMNIYKVIKKTMRIKSKKQVIKSKRIKMISKSKLKNKYKIRMPN